MKILDVINTLEQWAPPAYQESYDNSRLIVGDRNSELTSVLISLDCTEDIVQEAIECGANLIVAHHPIVFSGLKSLTGANYVERTIIKAIKADIAIYSIHTNLDNERTGVNKKISDLLSLRNTKILSPKKNTLSKLVTFVPASHKEVVLDALYKAGAGQVGKYDNCSFQAEGIGTFRPIEGSNPFIGKQGTLQNENETRIEILLPSHMQGKIIDSLNQSHPYEEVAYYLTELQNENQEVGSGMIGELKEPIAPETMLANIKKIFHLKVIKHTAFQCNHIKKIAVCGGSGSFLLQQAKRSGADLFITSDFKYHEFFDAENQIIIADIGHYESEVFTKELIYDFLNKKMANIALNLSKRNTNPIKYS